ncbi:MAG: hypothetical protein MnENMB40S_07560 [Rhizobiaceae bacterium MnEN-MB40S]|nr:MAG: hypothetical protein MnENMB40S_07560 [Rhizobiaceae bacterium MnEN-MB40S]
MTGSLLSRINGYTNAPAKCAIKLRQLLTDRSGVGSIEFAFLVPVLMGIYIASLEISVGMTVDAKVARAGNITLDLVTQGTKTTKAELMGMTDVAASILSPFSAENITLVYTGISVDKSKKAKIDWSWTSATNSRAFTDGAEIDIPAGLKIPNSYYVRVEISNPYDYLTSLPFLGTDKTSVTMRDTYYMRPRRGSQLNCGDC